MSQIRSLLLIIAEIYLHNTVIWLVSLVDIVRNLNRIEAFDNKLSECVDLLASGKAQVIALHQV